MKDKLTEYVEKNKERLVEKMKESWDVDDEEEVDNQKLIEVMSNRIRNFERGIAEKLTCSMHPASAMMIKETSPTPKNCEGCRMIWNARNGVAELILRLISVGYGNDLREIVKKQKEAEKNNE